MEVGTQAPSRGKALEQAVPVVHDHVASDLPHADLVLALPPRQHRLAAVDGAAEVHRGPRRRLVEVHRLAGLVDDEHAAPAGARGRREEEVVAARGGRASVDGDAWRPQVRAREERSDVARGGRGQGLRGRVCQRRGADTRPQQRPTAEAGIAVHRRSVRDASDDVAVNRSGRSRADSRRQTETLIGNVAIQMTVPTNSTSPIPSRRRRSRSVGSRVPMPAKNSTAAKSTTAST